VFDKRNDQQLYLLRIYCTYYTYNYLIFVFNKVEYIMIFSRITSTVLPPVKNTPEGKKIVPTSTGENRVKMQKFPVHLGLSVKFQEWNQLDYLTYVVLLGSGGINGTAAAIPV
jgi:hypothetical protein